MKKSKFYYKILMVCAGLFTMSVIWKVYCGDHLRKTTNKALLIPDSHHKVIVYYKSNCIFCFRAKRLLNNKGIKYEAVELSDNRDLHLKLTNQTGQTTVPYIFIDGNFIGGFSDLQNMEKEDKL